MRHKFRRRPRLAAAAAVSLAGGLLAVAVPTPAQAECMEAYVWYYKTEDPSRRHYLVEEECIWSPFEGDQTHWDETHTETSTLPGWAPEGAGYRFVVLLP